MESPEKIGGGRKGLSYYVLRCSLTFALCAFGFFLFAFVNGFIVIAISYLLVEFREVFSGDTGYAWAEAPKEALPLDCRPNFGVAWLTKDKFKVNETYNCKYTPGNPKVDIHSDSIFDCRSENSSMAEMIKRCWIIFSGIITSAPSSGAVRFLYKGLASGFVSGIVS